LGCGCLVLVCWRWPGDSSGPVPDRIPDDPTIGWLFLLQVIAAFALALAVLVTGSRLAAAAGAGRGRDGEGGADGRG
jgi:hypothetical protein